MAKRPLQSFAYSEKDGGIVVISEDDEYADNHPAVKSRPERFRDVLDNPHIIQAPRKQ